MDMSRQGWGRVVVLTVAGTAVCIILAIIIDSFSFRTMSWEWGSRFSNNILIPLIIAPPFFFFLLSKLRELAIAHHNLTVVASTDGLTSCLNRVAFTTLVEAYLERTQEQPSDGALLVIDVDHFKKVNDEFGHASGDDALKLIASAIKERVRNNDLLGRIGGEEFAVFLPDVELPKTVAIAERIRKGVDGLTLVVEGTRLPLSVSIGGAAYRRTSTFEQLFKIADRWLYVAKRSGRNRVEVHATSEAADVASYPTAFYQPTVHRG
ncbi:GGDEF domain-containing protein [Neoaquamicrobium sediminum]|uniref:diguanylate cyclase n=1 Tax=Neoaquamicrobium sediminum TaxID=1849104 RepID=A0ABV3X2Y0_9HYPH